jgi:hypothetical protein
VEWIICLLSVDLGGSGPTDYADAEALFVDPTGDSNGGKIGYDDIQLLLKLNSIQRYLSGY